MSDRELIEPKPKDKRDVRRDAQGRFKEVTDHGRASAADQRLKAKNTAKKGQGDKGDRNR